MEDLQYLSSDIVLLITLIKQCGIGTKKNRSREQSKKARNKLKRTRSNDFHQRQYNGKRVVVPTNDAGCKKKKLDPYVATYKN